MTKQHVVLPQTHHLYPQHQQPHPKDAWHQFEGLVLALVLIHLAAFAFWCWLLYKSKASKDAAAGGGGSSSSGAAAGPKAGVKAGAAAGEWRSTREILKAYQKAQLGKG